jgi:hypothetical protein
MLAVTLMGCATQKESYWFKANSSQADFNQDAGACRAQAFGSSGNTVRIAIVYNGCMQGKGWELRDQ